MPSQETPYLYRSEVDATLYQTIHLRGIDPLPTIYFKQSLEYENIPRHKNTIKNTSSIYCNTMDYTTSIYAIDGVISMDYIPPVPIAIDGVISMDYTIFLNRVHYM